MESILIQVEEVALAVKEPERAVSLFEEVFGLRFDRTWEVSADRMKVHCAMVGGTQFHVVSSVEPGALIDRFIQQRGEGLHHIAFRVRDLDVVISRLRDAGLKVVPNAPRLGTHGGRYAFLHPESAFGLLIELIEKEIA